MYLWARMEREVFNEQSSTMNGINSMCNADDNSNKLPELLCSPVGGLGPGVPLGQDGERGVQESRQDGLGEFGRTAAPQVVLDLMHVQVPHLDGKRATLILQDRC